MSGALSAFLAAELSRPAAAPAIAFADELARIGGPTVRAVLFYGSALRTGAMDGVLDFYVLVDDLKAWPQTALAAAGGAWLPPNVEYREFQAAGLTLRAKIAVMRADQFRAAASVSSLDTTVWARFAQPAGLVWSRDEAALQDAVESVAQAASTATRWAALLGPASGPAQAFWDALFRQTYAAELRIEPKGRERAILSAAGDRYAALLPLAWEAGGLAFAAAGDSLTPQLTEDERARGRGAWAWRRGLGKPLTVLRLMKAVFTFQGAADYAAWKIERHTGVRIDVTPWVRKHPILAAPGVAWTLWKKGVLR
ncbi:MAG: hypothetical protein B7Y99_07860 [Caulobacterales bacterium 32-69-10]|nr:MAG: hypothetical protein B7Y99_07860 [Caulobacterales bacterium 32-69-10]